MQNINDPTDNVFSAKKPSARSFGFLIAAILILVPLVYCKFDYYNLRYSYLSLISIGVATCCILVAILKPEYFSKPTKAWNALAIVLSKFISPIIIALIFIFLFIPVGSLYRLCGVKLISFKQEKNEGSFWLERKTKSISNDESFKNQF